MEFILFFLIIEKSQGVSIPKTLLSFHFFTFSPFYFFIMFVRRVKSMISGMYPKAVPVSSFSSVTSSSILVISK